MCAVGSNHQLMSLDMLLLKLRTEIDELKVQLNDREEQLSSLFKKISEAVSYFEKETEDVLNRLDWIG